jgi:hypothetical protein
VLAGPARRRGSLFEVDVELRGGRTADEDVPHARARVLLCETPPPAPAFEPTSGLDDEPCPLGVDDVYRDVLFHGPAFQSIESIAGHGDRGLIGRVRAAPPPAEWMADPPRTGWIADPRVLDGGLQLGILWSRLRSGSAALPAFAARYRQYRPAFPREAAVALEVRRAAPHLLVADLTYLDDQQSVVARCEGVEWTVDASLNSTFHVEPLAGAGR